MDMWICLDETLSGQTAFDKPALCVNSTAPRASITCHTHFFRRVHVAQDDRGILLDTVCVFLSMFHRTLLDIQLSSHFSTSFPTLALGSSTSHSPLNSSWSPSATTLQGGSCFGRLAEQSLSQVASQSLSSKSAANTLRLSYLREEAQTHIFSRVAHIWSTHMRWLKIKDMWMVA